MTEWQLHMGQMRLKLQACGYNFRITTDGYPVESVGASHLNENNYDPSALSEQQHEALDKARTMLAIERENAARKKLDLKPLTKLLPSDPWILSTGCFYPPLVVDRNRGLRRRREASGSVVRTHMPWSLDSVVCELTEFSCDCMVKQWRKGAFAKREGEE